MKTLYLASASPRRAELLRQVGVSFATCAVDLDESWLPDETLEHYVCRLAREKALAAAARLPAGSVVLAADTAGSCNGKPLLKPRDEADAVSMLRHMSGRPHTVATAVSVCSGDRIDTCVVSTRVHFRAISEQEARDYWATGEPCDKAGAYGIQGLGAVFVESINGSYSGVVGLPLCETTRLLQQFGIACWQPA